ncbi:MAG: aromatic ring-hydroxylating dioxygenase subunit alpha [Alicyclobacillus herbarius]|nr:aromatic ring-hydroxylating dioxygenase subunit alpha [Alicyclobacillus herbarius]
MEDRWRKVVPPRNCSFNPEDFVILSEYWFPVATSAEVNEKPVPTRLLDVDLVCYRANGVAVVARDLCAHRGVPLSLGWVEGNEIVCPYHGFRYGTDGRCTAVPARQQTDGISPKLKIHVFPAIERYGLIWTTLNGTRETLPPFPEWDNPEFQGIMPPTIDIAGSAGRQMEGFLDVAHFAWVHSESFGDRNNPYVPSYTVETTDYGLHVEYLSTVSNYPKALQHLAPPNFQWLRVFDVYPPFAAKLTVHFPNDGRLVILNAPLPMSSRMTRLFSPLARNFDKTSPVEETRKFNLQIFVEDKAIIESQKPEELPLDLQTEAHIAADLASIHYRKKLKELGLSSSYTS